MIAVTAMSSSTKCTTSEKKRNITDRPPAHIRSAEGNRTSSCLFADRVARLSIAAFEEHCPKDLKDSYKQTVLAAFLIQRRSTSNASSTPDILESDSIAECRGSNVIKNEKEDENKNEKEDENKNESSSKRQNQNQNQMQDESLEVVSFGVGTKVLPHKTLIEEYKLSQLTGKIT